MHVKTGLIWSNDAIKVSKNEEREGLIDDEEGVVRYDTGTI